MPDTYKAIQLTKAVIKTWPRVKIQQFILIGCNYTKSKAILIPNMERHLFMNRHDMPARADAQVNLSGTGYRQC